MVTTFFILSAMFLALFVLDIPLVILVGRHGNKCQSFYVELSANLFASACVICLLATLGVYLG